eukprot:jgi/Botrbrau1/22088/Bobra.0206s0015.2
MTCCLWWLVSSSGAGKSSQTMVLMILCPIASSKYHICKAPYLQRQNPLNSSCVVKQSYFRNLPHLQPCLANVQVHARPRIQAECMEGQKWVLEGESEPRVVVWAHCLEFRVNWYQQVTFHDGEVYSWRKIPTFVYGGLKGVDHLYLRHKGTLCIRNHSTGFEVHMKFVQPSMLSMKKEAPYDVEGIVLDNGLPVQGISIQGQWNDKLYLMRSGHAPQLLWQAVPYPPLPSRYNWTYWSIMLGEIKPGMEQTLPCTDSRFRPDRILMSMDCMKMRMQSIEDYCVLMKLAQAPRRSQKSRCAKLTLLCGLTSMTQVSNLARV